MQNVKNNGQPMSVLEKKKPPTWKQNPQMEYTNTSGATRGQKLAAVKNITESGERGLQEELS